MMLYLGDNFKMDTRHYLKDLGFEEIKTDLFRKNVTSKVDLFVDFRGTDKRKIYAYHSDVIMDHTVFKEYQAIVKIENYLRNECAGTLLQYVPG